MTSPQNAPPDTAPAADPADRLERLAQVLGNHAGGLPVVRYGGHVTEVAATHVLVRGIERKIELGSSVEVEGGGERWLGCSRDRLPDRCRHGNSGHQQKGAQTANNSVHAPIPV